MGTEIDKLVGIDQLSTEDFICDGSGKVGIRTVRDVGTHATTALAAAAAQAEGVGIYFADVGGCTVYFNVDGTGASEVKQFVPTGSSGRQLVYSQNGAVVSTGYNIAFTADLNAVRAIPCGAKYARVSVRSYTTTIQTPVSLQTVVAGSKGDLVINSTNSTNGDSGDNSGLIDISDTSIVDVTIDCYAGTNVSDFSTIYLNGYL